MTIDHDHTSTAGAGGPGLPAWVPAAVLVVCWLVAWPFVQDYVNPDGASYAEVAELLVEGRWATSVNGYFGPLLSWLAAPVVAVGVPSLLALRLVLLGAAVATLPSLRRLATRAGATAPARDAVVLASTPFLASMAWFGLYADVVMAAALLRGLDVVLGAFAARSAGQALRGGAWLGLAFLARAYAAPVVVVTVPLAAGYAWLAGDRADRVGLLGRAGAAAAGFALVAGAWAGVLTATYDRPTLSTSAGFNAELVTPGSAGNPYNVPGLYEPPRDDVVSAWIEPSRLPVPRVDDATDTAPTVGHRLGLAVANARIVVGSVLRRGAIVGLLALVGLVTWARRRGWPPPALVVPLLAGAVAAGGLLLIIAIERYLWFPILACVPAAAVGLDALLAKRPGWWPAVTAGLVLVVGLTSADALAPRVGAMEEVTLVAAELADTDVLEGRVAAAGHWEETHQLCVRVGCQYLGRPRPGTTEEVTAELRAADVDHLVVWDDDRDRVDGLGPVSDPVPDSVPDSGGVTVYDVGPDGLVERLRVRVGS